MKFTTFLFEKESNERKLLEPLESPCIFYFNVFCSVLIDLYR